MKWYLVGFLPYQSLFVWFEKQFYKMARLVLKEEENKFLLKFLNRFLSDEGVKSRFYFNLIKSKGLKGAKAYTAKFSFDKLYDYAEATNFAFTWSETNEGHAFWRNIYDKWQSLLDKCFKRLNINRYGVPLTL